MIDLTKYKKNIWRPFTQEALANEQIVITSAKNQYLYDNNNKQYIDFISSWWVNIHGHCNNNIVKAIKNQTKKLDHVIFSDFCSESSLELIHELQKFLDKSLSKFFFSDNGSTSVEVALKIAYQYHINIGNKKKYFITFDGSYHGDTFGSMSIGASSNFFNHFKELFFTTLTIPYPDTWIDDFQIEEKEKMILIEFEKLLFKYKNDIAGFVIEPLIQGASGMRMCRKEFLNKICIIARNHNILLIFDEVMTGFARTGKMFGYEHLNIIPDIICLSKGITGGFLPLGMTIVTDKIYQSFCSQEVSKTFLHGHSYTGNPISCAAAVASLKLFNNKTFQKIENLSKIYYKNINELMITKKFEKFRILGSICAFDYINHNKEYNSNLSRNLKKLFLENGFILRPLGNTVYLLPPYCISNKDIEKIFDFLQTI